ncbi:MAG: hypothetical protein MUE44_04095 [Oscillatoriaceae cyanobacterium Prado104]|nr:hypothetical protein [Oscillatoriaceae cyanobacterium Prado104]
MVCTVGRPLQAQDIQDKLKYLISEATPIEPTLAIRLGEVDRWVKDVKPGALTNKKFVLAFLLQLVSDSEVWLTVKSLPSEASQQAAFELMTPAERYWYGYLFPKWLSETDRKFYIWKKKLMAGKFNPGDERILRSIAAQIRQRADTSLIQRYIADFSMATDSIVSNRQQQPLCIQVTTMNDEFSEQKYQQWQQTLQTWGIDRGLFLSYDGRDTNFINQLVNIALYNSDNLPAGRYLKFP